MDLEIIRQPRIMIWNILSVLSTEQLNKVPEGFNNNIIWNLAHMVAAQQGICYRRAGLPLKIEEEFFLAYRPDTKPGKFVDDAGVEKIKSLMFSTLDEFQIDYDNQIFTNYPAFTTRYGVELSSIDTAIAFIPFHEGFHIGAISALKKLV